MVGCNYIQKENNPCQNPPKYALKLIENDEALLRMIFQGAHFFCLSAQGKELIGISGFAATPLVLDMGQLLGETE